MYQSLQDTVRDASSHGSPLGSIALAAEASERARSVSETQGELGRAVALVRSAIAQGVRGNRVLASGILCGDAGLPRRSVAGPLHRTVFNDVLTRALAVHEVKATVDGLAGIPMGIDAGIVPALLTGVADARGISDDRVADAFSTSRLIRTMIAERSTRPKAAGEVGASRHCDRHVSGRRDRDVRRNAGQVR